MNQAPGSRRKLNMQKYRVQVTVHFENLKFPNTGNQMKEMHKKIQ